MSTKEELIGSLEQAVSSYKREEAVEFAKQEAESMVRKGVENAGAIDAIVDIEVNRREFGSSEGGHNILLEAIVHAVATGKPSIA
ncbi:MAG: hypothetical protein IKP20_04915 [Candidatus Methanomethylophilaceae archaeon]|nr:hypothetical protein [Candidatus Methanomethylophilaceae archaeon]